MKALLVFAVLFATQVSSLHSSLFRLSNQRNILSTKLGSQANAEVFDSVCNARYACTRFQRNDGTTSPPDNPIATNSNMEIVQGVKECLDISRRAPSGFNAQPYKLLMVRKKEKKEELAKYCIGRNADRVRDSDCTVLFLADRECLREYKRFGKFLDISGSRRSKKPPSRWAKRKIQALILLFSSGWPLPRLVSNPISFAIRTGSSFVSAVTRRKVLVPSLGSAETWATKNTMLVAMTFLLACTSRGYASCPMEGYNIGGIRRVLSIPRRYSIPLIASVGLPYERINEDVNDDVGMQHGPGKNQQTHRYPTSEVIFEEEFQIMNQSFKNI